MFLALGGLGFAAWLVVTYDMTAVLAAFSSVGWGLALMVLVRLAILATCAAAWQVLLRQMMVPDFGAFFLVRFVLEAINVMLPVGTVGGDIIGGRLITFWHLTGGIAGASPENTEAPHIRSISASATPSPHTTPSCAPPRNPG